MYRLIGVGASKGPGTGVRGRVNDKSLDILQEAISGIRQGLLVVDAAGNIVFVNQPYLDFFGLDGSEAELRPGQPLEPMLYRLARDGIYGPGDAEEQVRSRFQPVRDRVSYHIDRRLSSGIHLEVAGTPLDSGGYVFTFTDVTDRVEEKERLDWLVKEWTEELQSVNSKLMDGIEYARLIQTGILPGKSFYDDHIGANFILFRPSDIVGGDFYLGVKTDYGTYIGLGDCTGHGVPGAMMTMMAASVCRRAISEIGQDGPASVMMAVDRIVRVNLHQTEAQVGPDNGLELTMCLVENDLNRVHVAGAGLDVLVQREGRIDRIKGTKHGLGYGRQSTSATSIQETVLMRDEVDRVFMSSDGILDQSGGEKGFGFGRRRLIAALEEGKDLPIEAQGHGLLSALDKYSLGYTQRDDLAVLGFSLER